MFLPNTANRTQAAVSVHSPHPPTVTEWSRLLLQFAAMSLAACMLQCIFNGDDSAVFRFLSVVTLTFDLDI